MLKELYLKCIVDRATRKGRNKTINIRIFLSEQIIHNQANNLSLSFSSSSHHSYNNHRNLSTPSILLPPPQLSSPSLKQEHYYKLLTNRIINERKVNAIYISNYLKSKLFLIKFRKKYLIERLLQYRIHSAIHIQRRFRVYLIQKEITAIIKSTHFFFFYSITENVICKIFHQKNKEIRDVKLKFFSNKDSSITATFLYSKCLQLYYVPLKNKGPLRRRIRVNFIINEQCIIDPRYDVDTNERGEYYNLIEHSMLFKPLRRRRFHSVAMEQNNSKYWETIFQIKNQKKGSCDSNSLSEISIDHYMSSNSNMIANKTEKEDLKMTDAIKGILKPKNDKPSRNKKVSFNYDVEYGL